MEYVVGFLFSECRTKVALIKKTKPLWQSGFHNGIGGKIEHMELPSDAMFREFQEETGLMIGSWNNYAILSGNGFRVYFYFAFSDEIYDAKTITEEDVIIAEVDNLPKVIPNLKWLIPMALSMKDDSAERFEIQELRIEDLL